MTVTTAVAATPPSWTLIGALASPDRAVVDPAGVLQAWGARWALDWAVGAEDRWYRASTESGVRQRLLGDAPVVETRLRVPGGDVVHRAYGARPAGATSAVIVVEIENQTPVPVALALGVAPGAASDASIGSLEVRDLTLHVDGRPALVLPRGPNRAASTTDGDALAVALRGDADDELAAITDPSGAASAALVFPLPHTATLRIVVLPGPGGWRPDSSVPTVAPIELPAAAQVATGWGTQRGRGTKLRLPDARLAAAVDAARCTLLVLHDGPDVLDDLGKPADPVAEALVLVALARTGFHLEAAEVLRGLEHRLGSDGWFDRSARNDANGALLWALLELWRATGSTEIVGGLVPHVAAAAAGIDKRCRSRFRRGGAPAGLLPAGPAPTWVGGEGVRFWDDLWAVAGLRAATELLIAAGEARAAAGAGASALELATRLRLAMEGSARDGLPGLGPLDGPAPEIVALLIGSGLLDVLDDDIARQVADDARRRRGDGAGVPTAAGHLDVRASLLLALHDVSLGEARGQDGLVRLVGAAGHALSLPDVLDPATRTGAGAVGHDPIATALLVLAGRALLVRDEPDAIDLVPVAPAAWWGQRWEALRAPTRHGVVSTAVRWRDDHPILLWELEPRSLGVPVELRAGALAPGWSTHEPSGEVELPAIAAPGGPVEDRRRRRIAVAMGGAAAQNRTHGTDDAPEADGGR